MNIRWRLAIALVQLLILCAAAFVTTGTFLPFSVWFVSGAIAVVLALQLTEPFFPRPTDVLVASASVVLIVLVADRTVFEPVWWGVGICALIGLIVAVVALTARREGAPVGSAGAEVSARAYQLVRAFSGKILYSAVFVVAVLAEYRDRLDLAIPLGLSWATVVIISNVRWDRVLLGRAAVSRQAQAFGLIGPARLMISSTGSRLEPGTLVNVKHSSLSAEGYVVRRVNRRKDVLLEIQLETAQQAERLLGKQMTIQAAAEQSRIAGVIGTDTTSDVVVFHPFEGLEIGHAVVARSDDGRELLHQVTELRIVEEADSREVGDQRIRAHAVQLGVIEADGDIALSRRILGPGAPLWRFRASNRTEQPSRDDQYLELGTVLDTDLPVWMDTSRLVEGHMAILGMTRMGKSSFARRLAGHLSTKYPVIVVDQTGEYRSMGLPLAAPANVSTPGLYLKDLETMQFPHKEALKALRELEKVGRAEYAAGTVRRRVLILEEAHQFVPEPALLGFGAPGRDEAIEFGLLMMQVRKFGVSIILISQRTAVVAKSALSQCENIVAFKSVDQTGLEYLEAIGGAGTKSLLPKLRQGEAVVLGTAISAQSSVAVTLVHDPLDGPGKPPVEPEPDF